MRHYILASHHKLAYGLKDTLVFLTNMGEKLQDISAYIDNETSIDEQIKNAFSKIGENDEVIIMTDLVGGSVNQKFYPFMNNHIHLISGVNLPLALSLLLIPEDTKITKEKIQALIKEAQEQIVYVNTLKSTSADEDE